MSGKRTIIMTQVRKAYGYVTRMKENKTQVLVFQHPIAEAGIQIPKGTVKPEEDTHYAVAREIEEETGLRNFYVENLLAEDFWENDDGTLHNRFFYKITVSSAPDDWDYQPTGGGDEEGLTFRFFWISSENEIELIRGHGDYLHLVFN
jgi:8-oxo-dGTP pyrophosphatase MutT (NUDIX family)